ncbi:NACHT domain-containing protein [Anaerocolumna sp.]|uniref:NACHT domain-containing protein n=1 Tax=Anaerocolumna sp. TaxID=2041569 RepID=UPI0028AEDA09|nr:hypothetical protein [Anaerocolumna sp.]
MIELDWAKFEILNKKYTDAFETLCLHLFSRFVHTECIVADFNQAGLETEPVKYKGKFYGFQSKYFSPSMDYKQIEHSVKKALALFPDLDVIKIFYNCNARLSMSPTKKELDESARKLGAKLEWLGRSYFETALNKKENLDLCQLFFGTGRELEYFADIVDVEKRTFLTSDNYLELEVLCAEKRLSNSEELVDDLLVSSEISVIRGLPGTGKSVLFDKIFMILSGSNQNFYEQIAAISKNKSIPILIKLKYCSACPLEQLIIAKKTEYKLDFDNYSVIYLFDGLDEVSSEIAEQTVSYIKELVKQKSTKKIILSVRKMSSNNMYLYDCVKENASYEIQELDEKKMFSFFESRREKEKIEKLKSLKVTNKKLLCEIQDILLLNLFYDSINHVNDGTTIYDLFWLKDHYWNSKRKNKLTALDLPEPQSDEILEINKRIAYQMHCSKSVIISQKNFRNIVSKRFPKLSYKGVNAICNYILETYFENGTEDEFYSYQHRRYQEYFYTLSLYDLYKYDVGNLRKEQIFTNYELFDEFVLPYLEDRSDKEKQLPYSIEVRLFKTYMGKNPLWGADEPGYKYLNEFCYAIAAQEDNVFYRLIQDENLSLKGNVLIDASYIKSIAKSERASSIGRIPDPLEEVFRFVLCSIEIFWKCNKKDVALKAVQELQQSICFIRKEYPELLQKVNNAFFEEKGAQIFIELIFFGKSAREKLEDINKNGIRKSVVARETEYERLCDAFFEVVFRYRFDEVLSLLDLFTDENIECLCNFLIRVQNLRYLKDKEISEKLRKCLNHCTEKTKGIVMLKKYFDFELTAEEEKVIEEKFERLSIERWVDLFGFKKEHNKAAFLSMVLKRNCVSEQYKYDTRVLYQNLYCNYAKILDGEITYTRLLTAFFSDYNNTIFNRFTNITYEVTSIFALVIGEKKLEYAERQNLLEILSQKAENTIHMGLLFKLLKNEKVEDCDKLIRRFLPSIKQSYQGNESFDTTENVKKYFNMAYLYANFDSDNSLEYIRKGLNSGVIRHGWRKDGIVDTFLLDALEIMWNKYYFEWNELQAFTEKYFQMILAINQITDENYRCSTIKRLIEILLENDLELAKEMMKNIVSNNLQVNDLILQYSKTLVKIGESVDEIILWFNYFDIENYNEESISMKLQILLLIYKSDWYDKKEKEDIKDKIKYYAGKGWISTPVQWDDELFQFYLDFCQNENIGVHVRNITQEHEIDRASAENKFCKKVAKCKTKKYLQKLFNELMDYHNHIIIQSGEDWNMIVDRVYEIDGNVDKILTYMESCKFPHDTYYTSNSLYLYMPLGRIIEKEGLTAKLWNHLKKNGGYGDFINLIKAYEYISNKKMCRRLFIRFFRYCEFLVYDEAHYGVDTEQ